MSISVGDLVKLRVTTGTYRQCQGMTGTVGVVGTNEFYEYATVCFDDGSETGITVRDIPLRYLARAGREKPKQRRRGVLNLHAPKDERTEAQRMDEAIAWLRANGYEVLRVGQSRQAAICHQCSRSQGRMVRIKCSECGSQGFSPSTNSTKGTPDTFVYREDWPMGMFLGVEWKDGPGAKRSEEQAALEAAGRIIVAWDTPTCLIALYRFEADDPRIIPGLALVEWLKEARRREH